MLISFSVTNYRSIKDTATLSFLPVKPFKELPGNVFKATDKISLLRSAVIYGANASGKSNVLRAFEKYMDFLLNSVNLKPDDEIPLFDPFKLNTRSIGMPAKFSIDFIDSEGIRNEYSIEINNKQVLKEELTYYPKGQSTLIFIRIKDNPIKYGAVIKGEKKSIEARLLKNQLFFSKGANENISPLQNLYIFLNLKFTFQIQFRSFLKEPMLSNIIARLYAEQSDVIKMKLLNLVSAMDIGIVDIKVGDNNQKGLFIKEPEVNEMFTIKFKQMWAKEFSDEIYTVHNIIDDASKRIKQIPFSIKEESDGTRSLFVIALFLLIALEEGEVFVIDEVEQNLHPQIVNSLINIFNNPEINTKNAQLICTTHNTNLLADDIFRRDQIWFTEKNERGETALYSMADIEGVRNNIPYDKWYLSGRFGATPIVREPDFLYRKNAKGKK